MIDDVLPLDDVLTRVLAAIRKRIEEARANGQRVKVFARETGRSVMSDREFRAKTLEEIVAMTPSDGGLEIVIRIEPKQ